MLGSTLRSICKQAGQISKATSITPTWRQRLNLRPFGCTCIDHIFATKKRSIYSTGATQGGVTDVSHIRKLTIREIRALYDMVKKEAYSSDADGIINKHAVFANNEMSLKYIDVYGFDYDYTLASYSDELHNVIYKMALKNLVDTLGYPRGIKEMKFNPHFGIRGLHFDIRRGLLMKLDSFTHIQLGSVYKGYQEISDWDVIQMYGGTHVAVDTLSRGTVKNGTSIHQLIDLFSIPFMGLLSNVIEYLTENNISFDPEYVYYDVEKATQEVHWSGKMHKAIEDDLDTLLPYKAGCAQYLERLKMAGKNIFMITNSKFDFVNKGMKHLVGNDWRDLFDVIVTQARKPKFFSDVQRPFRTVDTVTGHRSWDVVTSFERDKVYAEGNIRLFRHFTKWEGTHVLYFGDHVYSDLMDPVLRHGWRTGAIIPELEREILLSNSKTYRQDVRFLLKLEDLMSVVQAQDGEEMKDLFHEWRSERKVLRRRLKEVFNPYFGSVFRTYHNPTFFSRRLTRYADIYTSSVDNLLKYPMSFTFYPRRSALPHEE